MAELAAHMVDGVIPDVPTRQWPASKWLWSMPIALRLHLAADPNLCRDVASAFIDAVVRVAVLSWSGRGARAAGALDAPGSTLMGSVSPILEQLCCAHRHCGAANSGW